MDSKSMGCADVSFVIASARDHFLGWAQDKARPGRQTHSIDLETMFPGLILTDISGSSPWEDGVSSDGEGDSIATERASPV
jgi:hypothetical protein